MEQAKLQLKEMKQRYGREFSKNSNCAADIALQIEMREQFISALQTRIDHYELVRSPDELPSVIAMPDLSSMEGSIGLGLSLARRASNQTQIELAEKLNVDQSRIAKLEHGAAENCKHDTLVKWASVTGFEVTTQFIKCTSNALDLANFGAFFHHASVLIGQYLATPDRCVSLLFQSLRDQFKADIVTCYAGDRDTYHLRLLHADGMRYPEAMEGMIWRSNVPMKVMNEFPSYVQDCDTHPVFSTSTFVLREAIESAIHIPFHVASQPGICFLSYRTPLGAASAEFNRRLIALSNFLTFVFSMIDHTKIGRFAHRVSRPKLERDAFNKTTQELLGLLERSCETEEMPFLHSDPVKNFLLSTCKLSSIDAGEVVVFRKYGNSFAPSLHFSTQNKLLQSKDLGDIAAYLRTNLEATRVLASGKNATTEVLPRVVKSHGFVAVPLSLGEEKIESGAVVFFDEHRASLPTRDICILSERCLQLGRVLQTSMAMRKRLKDDQQNESWAQQIVHRLSETIVNVKSLKEKLDRIAHFVNQLLGASATHIWPVVWRLSEFGNIEVPSFDVNEGGFASDEVLFVDGDRGEKYRPRNEGLSVRMLKGELSSPLFIRDAVCDIRVGDSTRADGFATVVGVVIQGPISYRPEGIMWIRFRKALGKADRMPAALQQNVDVIANLIHLLWQPSSFACPVAHKANNE
jgi:transcriptional regulator with XRE-family HTH domain